MRRRRSEGKRGSAEEDLRQRAVVRVSNPVDQDVFVGTAHRRLWRGQGARKKKKANWSVVVMREEKSSRSEPEMPFFIFFSERNIRAHMHVGLLPVKSLLLLSPVKDGQSQGGQVIKILLTSRSPNGRGLG
jgi:hypothetical protein